MLTTKTLMLAGLTALSLGMGTAMAQEGPNATVSGSTYFGAQAPLVQQAPNAEPGTVQSGTSDPDVRPSIDSHYFWTPGQTVPGAGSEG
jgi:hypothetical protein